MKNTIVQLDRQDNAFVLDLPTRDYDKTTEVALADNEEIYVYKKGHFVGKNGKRGKYLIGKVVKHLHKGLFSRTYKAVTMRFVRCRRRIYYFGKSKFGNTPSIKGTFQVEVKFVDIMRRRFDRYIKRHAVVADSQGVLINSDDYKPVVAQMIEELLPTIDDVNLLKKPIVDYFAVRGIIVAVNVK